MQKKFPKATFLKKKNESFSIERTVKSRILRLFSVWFAFIFLTECTSEFRLLNSVRDCYKTEEAIFVGFLPFHYFRFPASSNNAIGSFLITFPSLCIVKCLSKRKPMCALFVIWI